MASVESDFKSSAPDGFFLTNDVPFEGVEKKTFQTEYELLDLIGKGYFRPLVLFATFCSLGTYSEVKKCRHRKTGKLYAVKISKRSGENKNGMRDDEIQILVNFGQHPNIITVKVCTYYSPSVFRGFTKNAKIKTPAEEIHVNS